MWIYRLAATVYLQYSIRNKEKVMAKVFHILVRIIIIIIIIIIITYYFLLYVSALCG